MPTETAERKRKGYDWLSGWSVLRSFNLSSPTTSEYQLIELDSLQLHTYTTAGLQDQKYAYQNVPSQS